ncbi:hypothetical protein AB5I39_08590 [Sphingomonas sp. MMS24-J45]|uniref:hypothetical protein n=1 Tax=Sphingomonas sp. MMS24-J45 TaxID=3238806 RepID=UPI00384B7B87
MTMGTNSTEHRLEAGIDRLAELEHERWAHWQRYMHSKGKRTPDGSLVLPANLVARWDAQIATAYRDLTSDEKESDREQVRRYLPTVAAILDGKTDDHSAPSEFTKD